MPENFYGFYIDTHLAYFAKIVKLEKRIRINYLKEKYKF